MVDDALGGNDVAGLPVAVVSAAQAVAPRRYPGTPSQPLLTPVAGDRLSILALEPYYGGSHRAVLDALAAHVDADWHLLTLPARKWKWRMRGAAITFAEQARQLAADAAAGRAAIRPRLRVDVPQSRRVARPRRRTARLGARRRLLPREPARVPQSAHRRMGLPVPPHQHHLRPLGGSLPVQHAMEPRRIPCRDPRAS